MQQRVSVASTACTFFALIAIQATSNVAIAIGLGVTPPEQFSVPPGFEVDLVYEVPRETQGSWVSLTVDPQGRLIACDQSGGLYRIDASGKEAIIESLKVDLAGAQGLLCAFGSLYANVNLGGKNSTSGIWRLTDTNGDDQYDKKEHIVPLNGGGEHGPHALILSHDGNRIIMCAGNNTNLPQQIDRSRVPQNWDEDHLLGRMPDARGHNANRLAPGGFILSLNPDGSELELIATGFRNEYDIALNRDGELFAYDADMEWDVGTPWYRPTRINHVISGAEFGWRNGTGKWPEYYPDSFGAAVDIGPGSPTGIVFGYGTNFPEKFQNALFIADWSYGNIHAVHLEPDGSSYTGTYETFATAAPLPVTDLVVHPDGALYFAIGGRNTQSGLYRIRYQDPMAVVQPSVEDPQAAKLRQLRGRIEATHTASPSPAALELALRHLGHEDRAIAFAARIALEHQPLETWRQRVTKLDDAGARILGVIALARNGEPSDQREALAGLQSLDWSALSDQQRVHLLRAYALVAIRLGEIKPDQTAPILSQFNAAFPSGNHVLDRELSQLLVYLNAPDVVARVVQQMIDSPSQENQIHYAMTLRGAKKGWTPQLHRQYFTWFNDIQSARGGMSFGGFIKNIKDAALQRVPEKVQQEELAAIIHPPTVAPEQVVQQQRPFVKAWTVEELAPQVAASTRSPDFEQGKQVFAASQCYKCHRMGVQGGILGPDLTGAGGRYNVPDLLSSIIEPSKVISDQYGATQFLTDDGRVVVGRVVNMSGNQLRVMTNMLDPSDQTVVERDTIESTAPAKTSMMPAGLLDTFTLEEIIDLVAYLRAGGNQGHPIYKQSVVGN